MLAGVICGVLCSAGLCVVEWNGNGLAVWKGGRDIDRSFCNDKGFALKTSGADPQVGLSECDFVTRTSQYFELRLRSDAGGKVEIFWATDDEPQLSQRKSCEFEIAGDGLWHDYRVRPFWPNGKRVRQLRFDPPQTAPRGSKMQISRIAICDSADGVGPVDAAEFPGVTFKYATNEKRFSTLLWTTDQSQTPCRHEFRPIPDGREHTYWFDLSLGDNGGGNYWYKKEWKGTVGWFGVMDMRRDVTLPVKDLKFVSERPDIPADVEVESFLPESGILREGREMALEVCLRNIGTRPARKVTLTLDGESPVELGYVAPSTGYDSLGGRLPNQLVKTVPLKARKVGKHEVRGTLTWEGGAPVPVRCAFEVHPSLHLPKAEYVPEPKPIKTTCEVGAISFTGWDTHPWERIRNFTPERKPLLGWYDEGSPEVVDWQIKWLVENGISYLILDWFPRRQKVTGEFYQAHDHWIRAFRQARYRKYLKWAVLWENEMNGHDEAFVREMARCLITEYFSMPEYYRIGGKPVVYVWNRRRLNAELAATGGCKRALDILREMSVAAGYKGVHFIAGRSASVSKDEIQTCRDEGFDMTAEYHYRGDGAPDVAGPVEGRRPFEDLADTSLAYWRRLHETGILPFLPSVTTGWDDRPWNGDHGLEVYGRTPENFSRICRDAVRFSKESGVRNFLLGPLNEWGEGSYAEPNREFGFGMYEAVRNAFGIGPVEDWPVNYLPEDVGLGPYPAKPLVKVEDKMWPAKLKDVRLGGKIGKKMDKFLFERIVSDEGRAKIFDEARSAFESRNDDEEVIAGRWRGEFWGKEMLSTARVAAYLDDSALNAKLLAEARRLLKCQDEDGYLGSYSNKEFVVCTALEECMRRFGWYSNWNIWNRKYAMWGLLELYRVTGERELLVSVERQMNQLIDMMHRLGLSLHDVGTLGMNGLPPMSILKPLLLLYRETGNVKYFDYAREMIPDWDRADGQAPNFLRNYDNGKPLWTWYPKPDKWAKSYEMMSCLEGLLEYYRLTGEKRIFDAVVAIRDNLAANESNPIGGVGFCDKFGGAKDRANAISEVCDSIHWMRLNYELYLLTGDVRYVDAIEFTYYNAFLAGVYRDGKYGAFAVRAEHRHETQYQCGYKYNQCCVDNVPRGFMDVAELTVTRNIDRTLFVNFYQDATVFVDGVKFEISGEYPVNQLIKVKTTTEVDRLVRFRIPGFGVRPTAWRSERIPKGEKTFEIWVPMAPRIVDRPVGTDNFAPPYPAKNWYNMRYAVMHKVTPETKDMWDAYRSERAATVQWGPLVLAKAKRLGLSEGEVFPSSTINGKGYAVRVSPIPAGDVLGAWEVELKKDGLPTVRTKACDFQSAADEPLTTGAAAFSVWF